MCITYFFLQHIPSTWPDSKITALDNPLLRNYTGVTCQDMTLKQRQSSITTVFSKYVGFISEHHGKKTHLMTLVQNV